MKKENMSADIIFYNGTVYSADVNDTLYESIAIKGKHIFAVGSNSEIKPLAGEETLLVNLSGKSIMPGINDAHNHAWEAGLMFDGLVLFGIDSIEKLLVDIETKVAKLPKGAWVQGGSWIESQFAENRAPNRYDLDRVAPHNCVVLERIFGACSVNSKALEAAGIMKDTPNPDKGKIEKDPATGEPTGVLHGTAVLLVREVMPGPFGSDAFGAGKGTASTKIMEKAIRRALIEYRKYGITSIIEPGVSNTICRAYHNLLKNGELTCRIGLMPNWHGFTLKQDEKQLDKLIDTYPFSSGYGNEWIRYISLKMAIDGGLTSGTALKSWPYKGEKDLRDFELRLNLDKLDAYIKRAHDNGWDIGIHVMGDVAIEKAVDAIYNAVKANPREHCHHIVHAYYPSENALKKIAEAKILVSAQGSFIYGEADGYDAILPREKQISFLPLHSYKQAGVIVSMSTDMPCAHVNPFWNMYSAVTRKGMRGYQLGEKECISVVDAVKMMTYNGACMTGEASIKGSLEPGKLADLVVLDRSLEQTNPEAIKDITVEATMLAGEIIYEK